MLQRVYRNDRAHRSCWVCQRGNLRACVVGAGAKRDAVGRQLSTGQTLVPSEQDAGMRGTLQVGAQTPGMHIAWACDEGDPHAGGNAALHIMRHTAHLQQPPCPQGRNTQPAVFSKHTKHVSSGNSCGVSVRTRTLFNVPAGGSACGSAWGALLLVPITITSCDVAVSMAAAAATTTSAAGPATLLLGHTRPSGVVEVAGHA